MEGGPEDLPPILLRAGELAEMPVERLRLFLIGSAGYDLLQVRLPPVELEDRQLGRQRFGRLPERQRVDDPGRWEVNKAMTATAGLSEAIPVP